MAAGASSDTLKEQLANDGNAELTLNIEEASAKPLARRKIVDRRDPDAQAAKPAQERRQVGERRNRAKDKSSGQAQAKPKATLDLEERIQQHRKKLLLAGCEPVMSLNFDCLAMDAYPSNEAVAAAKYARDYWLFIALLGALVFVLGFTPLVPALIAGFACGMACLGVACANAWVRRTVFASPAYSDLLEERKAIEFKALNHIRYLEGMDGLAWRCQKMNKYNSNLNRKMFNGMIMFSQQRQMLDVIRNRKQIRLYLLFMVEAQKAYKRLQKDYLENHFKYVEQGMDDSLSPKEMQDYDEQEGKGSEQ